MIWRLKHEDKTQHSLSIFFLILFYLETSFATTYDSTQITPSTTIQPNQPFLVYQGFLQSANNQPNHPPTVTNFNVYPIKCCPSNFGYIINVMPVNTFYQEGSGQSMQGLYSYVQATTVGHNPNGDCYLFNQLILQVYLTGQSAGMSVWSYIEIFCVPCNTPSLTRLPAGC